MSFDTKLTKRCDHWVIEEDHVVEADLKTVFLDQAVSNTENVLLRVNNVKWEKFNKSELLMTDDVTSQVNGTNTKFVVSKAPIFDGANKKRLAQRNIDITAIVSVTDEDVTAQFSNSGNDTLIVAQHRPLTSPYDIYAVQLVPGDVIVKVNTGSGYHVVQVASVESIYGKIYLKQAPPVGSSVKISYSYKARVVNFDSDSGNIELREPPKVGDVVNISYFYLADDGWSIQFDDILKTHRIIFDQPKQTNHIYILNEDVSSQFIGIKGQTKFYVENTPIIPPRAKPNTSPKTTMLTDIAVKHNGVRVMPINIDAVIGMVDLGFTPKKGDTVTISYHYRAEGPSDLISIDYLVSINKCRKCKRTGQVNDYDYDKLGEVVIVQKEQKMLQDLIKMTLAIKGSNTAHDWYGTSLMTYIGTTRLPDYYETKFKGELIDVGEKMRDLQTQQSVYQTVDNEEFFSYLDNISVKQSDQDPNFYEVEAYVVSQAGTAIPLDTSLYFSKPLIEKE